MLEYSLRENPFTDRQDDFVAHPHPGASYNREQFIDLMLQRGTTVTRTDILAVLNGVEETAAWIVENGGTFTLPLLTTGFRMPGVYESALDSFDPARHSFHVTVNPGTALREAEKKVKLSKTAPRSPQPQILEVKDSVSGLVDSALTPGGVVEIAGVNIKLTGSRPEVGLYFVAATGQAVKAVTIALNKPSQLIAVTPPLAAGQYQVKIVTQYSSAHDLKEPKTTIFSKTLTVA